MTLKFPHLRAAIVKHPWAIMPDRLEAIAEVIERRVEGFRLSSDEIAAIRGDRPVPGARRIFDAVSLAEISAAEFSARAAGGRAAGPGSTIAVINVMGIIAQHASAVDDISGPGGTSTDRVSQSLRSALNDPSVKSIVLNIDSPGGSVYGVAELATEIREGRGIKQIVAQVNSLAASAAYYIASAASEIVVTPSGEVGSIGVYALHQDMSERAKMEGFKFTFISAGKYKIEGHPYEPLQDEARAEGQRRINEYYDEFVSDVARGRGVKVADVRNGFGEGRVVGAKQAVAMRMADRVAPLQKTLARLSGHAAASGGGMRGSVEAPIPPGDDLRRRRQRLRMLTAGLAID